MKVLALVLGILSGLYGLFLSLIGGALIALLAAAGLSPTAVTIATILVYIVPLLSIIGGILVFSRPMPAAILCTISGLAWLGLAFSITATPDSTVDPKSVILPLVIGNGLAALFAFLASRRSGPAIVRP